MSNKELEQQNKKLTDEVKQLQEHIDLYHHIYETRCAPKKNRPTQKEQELESECDNLKEKIEKFSNELDKRIKEEIHHINHPKQIYQTVKHNCKYNLRVCEILKEILGVNPQ